MKGQRTTRSSHEQPWIGPASDLPPRAGPLFLIHAISTPPTSLRAADRAHLRELAMSILAAVEPEA